MSYIGKKPVDFNDVTEAQTFTVTGDLTGVNATFTTTDNSDNLTLTSTDADANSGPNVKLYRNSASPADGDALGFINFYGENDADEETLYGQIRASIADASDGTEDARFIIQTAVAGTQQTSRVELTGTETVINEDSKDLDFRVESDNDTAALFVQGSDGNVGIGISSSLQKFTVANTSSGIVGRFTNNINQTLDLGVVSGSGSAGGVYYDNANSGYHDFRVGGNSKIRLDASGNVLVATTSKSSISQFTSDSAPRVQVTGDGSVLPIFSLTRDVTGDGNATGAITFLNDNNSGASGATSKVYAAILGDIGTSDNNAGDDSGGNIRFYTKGEASSIANSMTLSGGGNLTVSGSISKGSGSFKIDHPLDSKSDTHHLVHSFVEAPQADNIYRGTVDLVGGSATVNIDTVAGMTDGTFVALNREIQCFTSNETGWTAIKGSVSENTLTITAQDNTCTDTVSWLVIGERKDQHIIDSDLTDSNGKIIVEPLKSDSIGQADFPIDENGD